MELLPSWKKNNIQLGGFQPWENKQLVPTRWRFVSTGFAISPPKSPRNRNHLLSKAEDIHFLKKVSEKSKSKSGKKSDQIGEFQSKKPNKVTGILGPCLNIKRGRHMDGTMPRSHLFIESESFWMKFIIFPLNYRPTAWKHQHPKGESEE